MTSTEETPPATETTTEPTLHDTINEQFRVLQTGLNDMFKMSRNMQDQLKSLQKSCRQVEKKTRVKKKRPQEPLVLSAELAKFLSQKKDTHMTKADVMKSISGYIKKENLQLQNDKRKFLPNKALAKLFGLKAADVKNMTFVEINKHVSQHLSKVQA
jgi:chromatin remodeling complex protein RSC6